MRYTLLLILAMTAFSLVAAQRQTEEHEGDSGDFPPLWKSAPGNLEEYFKQDNSLAINAWNYRERLGLYKILLSSSAKYFVNLGPNNTGNILWGLPLQHGWQYRTGRLADPSNVTTCGHMDGDKLCISINSWWACMNYYLSVIPFLGAVESGFFGELPYEIKLLPPDEKKSDFCHSVIECNTQVPAVMAGWRNFFQYLLSTAPNMEISASNSFSQDEALNYMWKAHVLSIAFAQLKFQKRLPFLSDPEMSFGENWASAVEFIAATHFPTDQNTTNYFQTGLPPRMLWKGDRAPNIADFTSVQNKVLVSLEAIRRSNNKMGGLLLSLWKIAMSTEEGRKLGRDFIESMV
nr:protein LEG1 homolog [Anolis sagrei ordinatus]